MLGNLLLGHATGKPHTNPNPSMHVPWLTSVKKPEIPAWHEPCSSPYFFLYSGGKKENKLVIPGTAHTLHLSHLHCYSAWRDSSMQGPWAVSVDRPPTCTMQHAHPQQGALQGASWGESQSAPTEMLKKQYHCSMKRAAALLQ